MRRKAIVLTAALLLTACQPAAPAATSSAPSGSSGVEASASEGSLSKSLPTWNDPSPADGESSGTTAANAPMPDAMPPQTGDALTLPGALASFAAGWSIEALTPAQYAMDAPYNSSSYRGFLPVDVFFAVRDGKATLFNANGKQISQDNAYDNVPEASWTAVDGAVTVWQDGQAGIVSAADGSQLVPCAYDKAEALPGAGYFLVEKDKTQQLLRRTDLSVAYTLERGDRFYTLGSDREALYQNSTLKLFDKAGKPVKNLVCDDVRVVAQDTDTVGVNRLAVLEGGKWALYDGDGELITNPVYDDFSPRFKGDFIAFQKTGKWGIMDYSGKVTIRPRWDDILLYDNSASLCRDNKWTGTTELDREPETTQPIYDDVGPFSEDGFAYFEKDGKYGLLDEDGNVMMTPRQSGRILAGIPGFDEGVYLVEGDNGPRSYGVMTGGQMVIPSDNLIFSRGVNAFYEENEPYNLVYTPSGKWGYIDGEGQYVIDTKFEEADAFIKGGDVAIVKLNGKICLINRSGNPVLETVFDDCTAFNPDTMVCAMRYTDSSGRTADCLVRLSPAAS